MPWKHICREKFYNDYRFKHLNCTQISLKYTRKKSQKNGPKKSFDNLNFKFFKYFFIIKRPLNRRPHRRPPPALFRPTGGHAFFQQLLPLPHILHFLLRFHLIISIGRHFNCCNHSKTFFLLPIVRAYSFPYFLSEIGWFFFHFSLPFNFIKKKFNDDDRSSNFIVPMAYIFAK